MSFWDFLFRSDEYIAEEVEKQVTSKTADLRQQVELLQQQVQGLQQQMQGLQQTVQSQRQQLQKQNQVLQKLLQQFPVGQGQSPKEAPAATDLPVSPAKPEKAAQAKATLSIAAFALAPAKGLLIRAEDDVPSALQKVKQIQPLQQVLQAYPSEEADIIGRMLARYLQKVERLAEKLPQEQKKWDEEEISEAVTEKIFSLLQKNLLTVLPVTIQRGYAAKPEFYGQLLTVFNQYLQQCSVYTRQPESQDYLAEADYDFMQIQPLAAKTQADDGRVDSIERLPYFLDYVDEDGERQHYQYDGQMYVYRYDAGEVNVSGR